MAWCISRRVVVKQGRIVMNIVSGVYYYLHSIIEIWYGSFRSTSAEDSMTDYENRPSASEISQAHESDQTATLQQKFGAKFLELAERTKGFIDTARTIYWHGFPLPSYKKEESATPREMDTKR